MTDPILRLLLKCLLTLLLKILDGQVKNSSLMMLQILPLLNSRWLRLPKQSEYDRIVQSKSVNVIVK